ncbi:hypothetical protein DSO57_1006253 [Entomophthora muscae]|uniref:Uncharacterized protein n=1 Tax=Entomophthora muscae TaxID=34485 RepID=A0ACC2TUQ3_9FUNG|nr:hypothetical protein DSO57_1006253 [Entomophthora muscae]
MILLVIKFVVFSLAPFLLLLWSTSPDLWSKISSSKRLASEAPSSLLSLPVSLLYSEEAMVKSLTCDDLDLEDVDYASPAPVGKKVPISPPADLEKSNSVPLHAYVMFPSSPTCTPWLLTRLVIMGLNAYFPQLSPVSSLWYPLQAVVPVLHWTASWWFVSPGWELNLVSLAPLSHTLLYRYTIPPENQLLVNLLLILPFIRLSAITRMLSATPLAIGARVVHHIQKSMWSQLDASAENIILGNNTPE